ncbi:MAG: tetratricopeptide repeat protein [Rhodospirillales bacterium]
MAYRRITIAVFVLAGSLWMPGAGPVSAEPVPVRSAAHQGYGRIVFNWPSPVVYSADVVEDRLIVGFGRAIEASYGGVVRRLGKYLRSAEPGGDGKSVIFFLKGNYGLRSFDMGSAVVIDLLDLEPPQAAVQPAVQTPAQASAQAPRKGPPIRVRSGLHKDFTRIVFDWPKRVGYQFSRSGDRVTVTFAEPAVVNLGSLSKRPPKYVRKISSDLSENSLSVTLTVPETSRVRHFYSGPKVVLDIMAPDPSKTAAVSPPAVPKPTAAKEPAVAAAKPAPQPATQPEQKTEPAAKRTASQTPKPAPAPGPGKPTALVPPVMAVSLAGTGVPSAAGLPPVPSMAGLQPPVQKVPAGPDRTPATAPPSGPAPVTAVSAASLEGGAIAIRFDWDEPVAAAVFRRAGFLWIVFDKPTQVDVEKMRAAGGNIFQSFEQIPSKEATYLRVATVAGINPGLKRDGLAWIFEFRKRPLQARVPIEPKAQPYSPIGARVFLPVPEPGKAVVLNDPEVGDSIIVVPVIPLGHGVFQDYQYPQFSVQMSGQGAVIQSRIDGLRVRPLRQGIEITSVAGLKLSSAAAGLGAGAKLGSMRPLTRVFVLDKWADGDVTTFNATKQGLMAKISKAKGDKRHKARMDLARFYFANGFNAETLGVLGVIGDSRQEILEDPEFRALRGTSSFLMGRLKDAKIDLFHPSLDDNDEGLFLRSALLAAEGDIARSARNLRRSAAITRKYPKALKIPLNMLVTEAAIMIGDIRQAAKYLKELRNASPKPSHKSQMDYIEGQLLELSGDFDGAVGKWEDAMDGPHRPSRAKAAVARAELLLKLREITRIEAIEEFEKLRFAWRGDDFEFQLLRRLGRLYMEEGDFRDGLRTLRQTATNFREYEKVGEITVEMTDVFERLYLGNEADSLAPVTAIALYDEFKELTPPGEKGDEMIRKLADRLVAVDLLDQGAKLLENQVKFRLAGEQKARVGSQLALVRIMARQPDKALEALDDTEIEGVSDDLKVQRRHLRARAMMDLERTDEALDLLKEDKSLDAKLLRGEIYWNAQDWPHASQELRRLAKDMEAAPNSPLDGKQSKYILNLAVALTLSGNNRGLDRVRRDYGEAMEASELRDAFRLIASPDTMGLIDFKSIAGKVKDVENFQAFLASYREKIGKESLSGIN